MLSLKKIFYTLVPTIFFVLVITTSFSFLGIGFEMYGSYLIFLLALVAFFLILPEKAGTLFS